MDYSVVFIGGGNTFKLLNDLKSCGAFEKLREYLENGGMDVLNGVSILCHYTNRTPEQDEESKQYLLEISKHRKVVALPEEVTLFVNDGEVEVIGDRSYYYFEDGEMREKKGNFL